MSLIPLTEYPVKTVLNRLLQDKTTRENIIFATDTYQDYGEGYSETDNITPEKLKEIDLKPRVDKEKNLQRTRTRIKAEVATPSWVCNKMNNHCDEEWFGRPDVFNHEHDNTWTSTKERITFPEGTTWQEYIDSSRIEITCGEAPYMVSRYDATTGDEIPIKDRIGILDRKFRIINENAYSDTEWLEWVERAYQSVYGFEFQGDNLLIARINLLITFVDYYEDRFNKQPDVNLVRKIANIISWNFWQMDGMTNTIPFSISSTEGQQMDLLAMTTQEDTSVSPVCRIYDWRANKSIEYTDLKKGN